VFRRTIIVNFLPALLEPILYLLAFGFGLGEFIPNMQDQSYINFIAPALVAIAVMEGSFFECTYSSFTRMCYEKTFDAIVATHLSVEEVVTGELLWGVTRSTINATTVLAIISALGLISSPLFLLVVPFAFLSGLIFASIAMCFTAVAPNVDFFNFADFLFLTPMFFLSGTFFPITSLPRAAQEVALAVMPLTPTVTVCREVISGHIEPILGLSSESLLLISLAWILIATIFFFILSINLMKKRLTG
jgi:lipooligosaccharide transport system permease protein